MKKILFALLPATLCALLLASPAQAANAFQTKEYYGIGGSVFDSINLAKAYELGYTGKGLTVGMLDDGLRIDHQEFKGKVSAYVGDIKRPPTNWDKYSHGTHVGGIMVSAKDATGMHGVAFNAKIDAFASPTFVDTAGALNYFLTRPDVRVINNSWNSDDNMIDKFTWNKGNDSTDEAFVKLAKANRVNVIAAGNEGQTQPGANSDVALRNPSMAGTMINVIAVDSSQARNNTLLPAIFTNLAGPTSDYSISAPGVGINAPNAIGLNGYKLDNGTSMAAPIVSGSTVLVQQAFPYMTNRQLVSTVLSTADKFTPAPFMVLRKNTGTTDNPQYSLNIVYFKGTGHAANVPNDLKAYFNAAKAAGLIAREWTPENYSGEMNYDGFLSENNAKADGTGVGVTRDITFSQAYGHGFLNVGKAVQGPDYFKASWLNPKTDIHILTPKGGNFKEWQYTVDTQGHTSVWRNGISQIQYGAADVNLPGTTIPLGQTTEFNENELKEYGFASAQDAKNQLGTLNIGLTKRGKGTLFLLGKNTYEGFTVIEDGAISLISTSDERGSVERVWVKENGILKGTGGVTKVIYNDSKVQPGNSLGDIVTMDYIQGPHGILTLEVDPDGYYDMLIVKGRADLDGKLQIAPMPAYWQEGTIHLPDGMLSLEGTVTGALTLDDVSYSPTLTIKTVLDSNYAGTFTVSRDKDAYSQYASNSNAGNVGQTLLQMSNIATGDTRELFTWLDFSDIDGSGVTRALNMLSPTIYNETAQASIDHNRSNSSTMLSIMQSRNGKGGATAMTSASSASSASSAASGISGGSATSGASAKSAPSGTSAGTNSGSSYSVIVPLGGGMYQQGQDGAFDSSSSYTGVQGAWNFHFPMGQAGISLGYSRRNTKTGGDVSESFADVLSLGGQVYMPEVTTLGPGVLWMYGSAALGLENTQITRKMALEDFYRQSKSDFSAFTASADARVGWEYAGTYAAVGPFAGLSYGGYFRPDLTESGGNAMSLHLPSADLHSLRSSLGLQARLFNAAGQNTRVEGVLSAAWAHEFLDQGTVKANFAGYGSSFYTDNVRGRDSVVTQASLNITHEPTGMSASLFGGAEVFRQQYTGYNVGFSVGWSW